MLVEDMITAICSMSWEGISENDLLYVAHAYYYFSVQFRENLEIACRLYPSDEKLQKLHREECNTSNLSPWDGVANDDEAMDHDEFMRRLLALSPAPDMGLIAREGAAYLAAVRQIDDRVRARSIASYEDSGLVRVFSAILRAPVWQGAGQLAFRHFLEKHIEFDSGSTASHGALSRHLPVDDSIAPLWGAFAHLLVSVVPAFARA